MTPEEKTEILEKLMTSSWWKILCSEIDNLIEERKEILETIDPNMKKIEFDTYDITRVDIANLKTLKNLPSRLSISEDASMADMSTEL